MTDKKKNKEKSASYEYIIIAAISDLAWLKALTHAAVQPSSRLDPRDEIETPEIGDQTEQTSTACSGPDWQSFV